jgi:PKD repeat protein
MIDRNFIFAKAEAFSQIRMPDFLKYNGENEYYSLAFISNGYDILSVPRRIYSDNYSRSVENTYHTFSSDHNYNVVVDLMNGINVGKYKVTKAAANQFLYYHNLVSGAIKKLPYATNDVEYDPYNLEMHEIGARKFLSGTKAVY